MQVRNKRSFNRARYNAGKWHKPGIQSLHNYVFGKYLARLILCVAALIGTGGLGEVAWAGPERSFHSSRDGDATRPGVRRYGPQYENRRYGPESDNRRYGPRTDNSSRDPALTRPENRQPTLNRRFPSDSRIPDEQASTTNDIERDTR